MCLVVFSPKLNINYTLSSLALQFILQIVAKVIFERYISDHTTHLLKTPGHPQTFKAVPDLVLAYLSGLLSLPRTHPCLPSATWQMWEVPLHFATVGLPIVCFRLGHYRLPFSPLYLANTYSSFTFQPRCRFLEENFLDIPEYVRPPSLCSPSTLLS